MADAFLTKHNASPIARRADRAWRIAFACARRHGLAWEDAQDCAQECVVGLLEAYPTLSPPKLVHDVDAWLGVAARHDVADYARHLASDRRHVVPSADTEHEIGAAASCEEVPGPLDGPEQGMARALFWECLAPAVDALDTRSHVCFVRRYLLHQAVKRIAAAEGLTPDHASQILRRARQRIARWLSEHGITEEDLREILSSAWLTTARGQTDDEAE